MKITEYRGTRIHEMALFDAYNRTDDEFMRIYNQSVIARDIPRKEYYSIFLYMLCENELISEAVMDIMLAFVDSDCKYQSAHYVLKHSEDSI